MTSRLRGLSGGVSAPMLGANSDTPTVASTAGSICACRTTMSDAIEWPTSASRPSLPGSRRANSAISAIDASSVRWLACGSARPPRSGALLRPWPGKSNVMAMKPLRARVSAKGCISCCEPAKPCAISTTGALPLRSASAGGRNTVTGVLPRHSRSMRRPRAADSSCSTATVMAASASSAASQRSTTAASLGAAETGGAGIGCILACHPLCPEPPHQMP